jgi:hypothetical protein
MDLWWVLAMITVASAPFSQVCRRAVPELVEFETGVFLDEGAGAVVAEADPAGFRADVPLLGGGAAGAGAAFGAEQRARFAAAEVAGQEH